MGAYGYAKSLPRIKNEFEQNESRCWDSVAKGIWIS